MLLVYKDMNLSDVIEEHTSLIPLLDRFGISLGNADKTVGQTCREKSIDLDFFLTVLNTFLNEDYFPERNFAAFHAEQILDYLRKTNAYYRHYQLPNIERHLKGFIASAPENPSLVLIGNIFEKARNLVQERIGRDETTFFPQVSALCRATPASDAPVLVFKSEDHADDEGQALLHDIKSVMVRHLTGHYDHNLCYAVIFAVSALERDMKQHDRIRYRILAPMVEAMENNRRGH